MQREEYSLLAGQFRVKSFQQVSVREGAIIQTTNQSTKNIIFTFSLSRFEVLKTGSNDEILVTF